MEPAATDWASWEPAAAHWARWKPELPRWPTREPAGGQPNALSAVPRRQGVQGLGEGSACLAAVAAYALVVCPVPQLGVVRGVWDDHHVCQLLNAAGAGGVAA